MNITSFLYHSGIMNEDGWNEKPIWEQEDNLKRFAELIVIACDQYVTERYNIDGFTEPWISPGDLLKHFTVKKTEWD